MGNTGSTGSTGAVDESAGGSTSTTGSATASASTTTSDGATASATGLEPGTVCPQIYAAVCGKDGETYDNACVAHAAGVEIRREGPCVGDCEGSCVVAPRAPSLVGLVLVVLALVRPRRRGR